MNKKKYLPTAWLNVDITPENIRWNKAQDRNVITVPDYIRDFVCTDSVPPDPIKQRTVRLTRIRLGNVFEKRPHYVEINEMREGMGLLMPDIRIMLPLMRGWNRPTVNSMIVVGHRPFVNEYGESFLYLYSSGGLKAVDICGADQGDENGVWGLGYDFVFQLP